MESIWVVLLGMTPFGELRAAIPAGFFAFGLPLWQAYLLAVLGNLIPIAPLLLFFEKFVEYLGHRWYWTNRFFAWLFERTRRQHDSHFHYWQWAPLALFIFVAIPLPFTGAWSGALAAIVFGIPFRQAFLSIFLGVLAAGGVVSGAIYFGSALFTAIL